MERSGVLAVIVCNTSENTVQQGYCYTCIRDRGYFGGVTKWIEFHGRGFLSPSPLLPISVACVDSRFDLRHKRPRILGSEKKGEAFLLTVGVFLLTVELLSLQSVEVLLRHTFPL